jgi:hypothetical protein
MKVLIHIEDVLGQHYATDLEIAMSHLQQGDDVHVLTCDGDLQTCPANPGHDWRTCILCTSKRRAGLTHDALREVETHTLDLSAYEEDVSIPSFSSIEDLKDFHIDGVNHGMEAASTVISALRKPRPDLSEHRDLVERSVFTAVALYREARRHIREIGPDRCYVLNGRRASQMPFVRAAWEERTKVYTFEVGHDVDTYILVEDTYFHDLENKKAEIEAYWSDDTPRQKKERKADRFFRDRRYGSGDEYPEAQFKDNQCPGALPDGLDRERHNIAIFNSSEDEFAAVEGYENPVYENQIEGLYRILEDEDLEDDIHFYLRVHPNLSSVDNYQTREIDQFDADGLAVIPADAEVDSYALMEACDKVLTFGSAMSIESAYAGKPSILVGREPYEDLGSCYTPDTHEQVISLLNERDLPPRDTLGAMKYGYYMVARDRAYEFYDPDSLRFLDRLLMPSRWARYADRLLREGPRSLLAYWLRRLRARLRLEDRSL